MCHDRGISSRFASSSTANEVSPVTLPPGWARLGTTPCPTGSPIAPMTIGMVLVARFASSAASVPQVRMTLTLRATRSSANSRNRWFRPSAYRYS